MENPSLMCMFIIRRLLLLSSSSCLPHHHSLRLPVAFSLFISPFATNLHHLPISNFPLSPPSLYSLADTLCLSLSFLISPLSPSWRTPLFLCLPPPPLLLCLAYFRHHPPPSCFLLCVCCLCRLTLLHQYGNESVYMSACYGRHSSAPAPSGL